MSARTWNLLSKYIFIPLDYKVFIYHLNSCVLLIGLANKMKAADFVNTANAIPSIIVN